MKKIPYGISNFKKLIEENYKYIDKTQYIEILESLNEQYIVFLTSLYRFKMFNYDYCNR